MVGSLLTHHSPISLSFAYGLYCYLLFEVVSLSDKNGVKFYHRDQCQCCVLVVGTLAKYVWLFLSSDKVEGPLVRLQGRLWLSLL